MGRNRQWTTVKILFSFLMATVLVWGLVGCSNPSQITKPSNAPQTAATQVSESLSEVAPPPVLQQLNKDLEAYQPQVTIVSPRADEVLQDTTVNVSFQVQDLPIFQNPDLGLGPHLHVILDNQPYQAVYNLDEPLVFKDLPPGTHTLRVFASRPWHESFKNEGAYAQTTFHVFTKTSDNNPDSALPLLTYSRPKGDYGAEPIMLDFYLTNAPLHLVAQQSLDDDIADWRIRVTINGQSFVLERWQPIYLKGFKPGKNWVRLEFLDEQGNPIKNIFNDTVRLITYEPNGKDTLSKLVRGELSAEAARGIVVPNYKAEPTPTPSPEVIPTPLPEVTPPLEEPTPSVAPAEEETQTPEPERLEEEPTPAPEVIPTEPLAPEQPKRGLFGRFRRPAPTVSPSPELPEELETSAPTVSPSPELPEELETSASESTVVEPETPEPTPEPEASVIPSELPAPVEEPAAEEPAPVPEVIPTEPLPSEQPKPGNIFGRFLNRFQKPSQAPSSVPNLPEELETPTSSEIPAPVEEPSPIAEPVPLRPIQPETPEADGYLNRFQSPDTDVPPTLPEIVETPFPEVSEPDAAVLQAVPSPFEVETSETPNSELGPEPQLDLEEILLTPPGLSPSPRIIQAPTVPEADIPTRFFKSSTPDGSVVSDSLEQPKINKDVTNAP